MVELFGLWMPIAASTVALFFASFVAWVVIGHHNPDWQELPNEAETAGRIKNCDLPVGRYIFPCARTKADMENASKQELIANGPWGTINIWSGQPSMGRNMALTFMFYLVANIFIAYLATLALEPGAGFSQVFQVTGTAAILAHCFAFMPNAIWFGVPKRAIVMDVLDGIVYGLLTGAIFGGLWP